MRSVIDVNRPCGSASVRKSRSWPPAIFCEVALQARLRVQVYFVDLEDDVVVLSEKKARAAKSWDSVVAAQACGSTIEATVTQVVPGGVLVDLGMRGFVPASHVYPRTGNLATLIGSRLRLKVVDLDQVRQRIVLSQRLAYEEERKAKRDELLSSIAVGQIREGVVVRLADFGAFVDIGGMGGLLHNSELSYGHIAHPSDAVKIGEVLQVEIVRIDAEGERVSLSLKHALPDPWVEHADMLVEGQRLPAKVVKANTGFMLVELFSGVLAMVKGLPDADLRYSLGDEVEVIVLTVNDLTRRITASIEPLPDEVTGDTEAA